MRIFSRLDMASVSYTLRNPSTIIGPFTMHKEDKKYTPTAIAALHDINTVRAFPWNITDMHSLNERF